MIFLINREYVLWEVVEMARLQIAEILKVPASKVAAQVDLSAGLVSPNFEVPLDECEGLTPDAVRDVMAQVYADCKHDLEIRLKGTSQTRASVLQWMRGGLDAEEYEALCDPALTQEEIHQTMLDDLAPVVERDDRAIAVAQKRWRRSDMWSRIRLVLSRVLRLVSFWR